MGLFTTAFSQNRLELRCKVIINKLNMQNFLKKNLCFLFIPFYLTILSVFIPLFMIIIVSLQ